MRNSATLEKTLGQMRAQVQGAILASSAILVGGIGLQNQVSWVDAKGLTTEMRDLL